MRRLATVMLVVALGMAFSVMASSAEVQTDSKSILLGVLSSLGGDMSSPAGVPIGTPEDLANYGTKIVDGISSAAGAVEDGARIVVETVVDGAKVVREFVIEVGTTIAGFAEDQFEAFLSVLASGNAVLDAESAAYCNLLPYAHASTINSVESLDGHAELFGYIGEGLENGGELLISTGYPELAAVGEVFKITGLSFTGVEALMHDPMPPFGLSTKDEEKEVEEEEEESNPATKKRQYKKLKTAPSKKEQAKPTPIVSKGKAKSLPKPKKTKSTPTVSKTKSTPTLKKTKSTSKPKWTKPTPTLKKAKSASKSRWTKSTSTASKTKSSSGLRKAKSTPTVGNTRSKKSRTTTPYRGGSRRGSRYQQWI